MKESYVRQTIRNFLATDFVAMAEGVVRANGGRIPTQPEYLRLQYAPKVNERREEARSDESMR